MHRGRKRMEQAGLRGEINEEEEKGDGGGRGGSIGKEKEKRGQGLLSPGSCYVSHYVSPGHRQHASRQNKRVSGLARLVFSYPRHGVREGSGSWMGRWGDCGVWAGLQNPKGPGFKYQLKAIRGKSGSATAARSSVVLWLNSLPDSLLSHFSLLLPASPLLLSLLTDAHPKHCIL